MKSLDFYSASIDKELKKEIFIQFLWKKVNFCMVFTSKIIKLNKKKVIYCAKNNFLLSLKSV